MVFQKLARARRNLVSFWNTLQDIPRKVLLPKGFSTMVASEGLSLLKPAPPGPTAYCTCHLQ